MFYYTSFCVSQEKTGESVPDAIWPENGDQWSDKEDDECGLLLEMAEEDEEIDLYNVETFGLGIIIL